MNSKKVISLSIIAIGMISISISTKSATLEQVLKAYCVPKTGNECTGSFRATFTGSIETTDALTRNYCQCGSCNMYYDKESRSCKKCPVGTYVNNRNSTECIKLGCADGFYSKVIEKQSVCPDGYYGKVLSNCNS